jgi:NADPH-dependent glutamate synthase beta subunit-like oxidoreductase/NAD(P)H-flavin reductase
MTQALNFNFTHQKLHERQGLIELDTHFLAYLSDQNAELSSALQLARAHHQTLSGKEKSELIIALGPYLDAYMADLFMIQDPLNSLAQKHTNLAYFYQVKRLFIQRRASRHLKPEAIVDLDIAHLDQQMQALFPQGFDEYIFAQKAFAFLESNHTEDPTVESLLLTYGAFALSHPIGRERHRKGLLFQQPLKIDFAHLIHPEKSTDGSITTYKAPQSDIRQRQGFDLTDPGVTLERALDQVHYCIGCHHQERDSCSKGLTDRKTGEFQKNPLEIDLLGCPLEEKISEMNELKGQGIVLGALAVITIDNPLCAATGHRICNDCMKACIYQKQEAVNIPAIESRILQDVLELPYGFEIYRLLTRWNPLNFERPYQKEESGYKVLIVGMGPSGFNLAHHLLQEGHQIVGIDGLKIEPLPETYIKNPIEHISTIRENLGSRVVAGFGGVAEYGITVRWDKNNLKIIRILLERHDEFHLMGGIRFGGTLTAEQAFELGFDHIALCTGAGKPHFIEMKNALASGVRMASDFLMSLQLTGSAKKDSLANLDLQLPVIVIGGGLTAIDTATEALAYYPIQVEKFYNRLVDLFGSAHHPNALSLWTNEEEKRIARLYIKHAEAIKAERQKANPDILSLLQSWGGVRLVYRGPLEKAPSYRLNHEEVEFALQEGIYISDNLKPAEVITDAFGHADGLIVESSRDSTKQTLSARTILIAAGTQPNTVLARENASVFSLDGKFFQAIDEAGNPLSPDKCAKPKSIDVFTHRTQDGRFISFYGDLHPSFAGNVVKAMASAKRGYPIVSEILSKAPPRSMDLSVFVESMKAKVHKVNKLTPTIIEVIVKAPMAAQAFEPGQFYRLQNFEMNAPLIANTKLAMEGIALTGASVDCEKGLISLIVLEMGGSSDLCALLKPGEELVLMGPTGEPTHIPENETVCLVGGGLGNAVLFSIGQAMRAKGCKVLYFAGYKKHEDCYKMNEIEKAADQVIWCCDEAKPMTPNRAQDLSFTGNIIEAMSAYAMGEIGSGLVNLGALNRMIVIGSDRMMHAVAKARYGILKPYLNPKHLAIGSINSPMQCMMKEICAQCIQLHTDPVTGKESIVYSCFNQDQSLDAVDFSILNKRLSQNNVHERLTAQWITHCLNQIDVNVPQKIA